MKKINFSFEFLNPLFVVIEKLSKIQRILICSATFILLVGAFTWFSFLPKLEEISKLESEIKNLETRLTTAQRNAAQLESWRKKRKDAEGQLFMVSKALPENKEIPTLLTNISRSGQDAGLDFLLFQPRAEIPRGFYAEIPVSIKVSGNYHAVALFFDKIAKLSRIVNIKDIKMESTRQGESLESSCTAVTYKFIEPSPVEEKKKK